MSTGSKNEGDQSGLAEAPSEPPGLSATAFGTPPVVRPQTPIPPGHQQAVELTLEARRHLHEGRIKDAKHLFHQATELELQVVRSVKSQPERSLIAVFGARAALQSGSLDLVRNLARLGNSPRAPESMQWSLLLVSIQTDLLGFMEDFECGWRVPWDPVDDEESRLLMFSPSGRKLYFEIDPDALAVSEKHSSHMQLTFVIPASRPSAAALESLESSVSNWLGPRRRVHPVLERRELVERFLMELVPV
jgi:hypothetical protein